MSYKLVIPIILSIPLLSGCTQQFFTGFHAQSHFDYPNSNIRPLGQVQGEISKTSFFTPIFSPDGTMKRQAIENAISKKSGADMLVNYTTENYVSSYFIIFNKLRHVVVGTAAETVDIGDHLETK